MGTKRDIQIMPRLLDRASMAACISLSEDALDRMRKIGCPSVMVPGASKVLFDPDDVVAWMKAQQVRDHERGVKCAIDILDKALQK